MDTVSILASVLLGVVSISSATAALVWRFSTPGSRLYLLDHPNERSLHTHPTPRTGGIAIVSVCVIGGSILGFLLPQQSARLAWLGVATLLLAVTSFVDDRQGLTVSCRLTVHLIVAVTLLFGGFVLQRIAVPGTTSIMPIAVAMPVTVLFIVWMVNLYNFMDGMDGFAGGMTVFGFGTYAVLGMLAGNLLFATLNLLVTAAAIGFLLFNFPPARIFMGDSGSSTLGLFAAAFSLWGIQEDVFPLWIALLAFSPFIVDATVTLVRRVFRKEKVWQAHRTHYYQRLVQSGWSHRRALLWEYAVMVGCATSAILGMGARQSTQWAIIVFWIIVYISLARMVNVLENQKRMSLGETR